MTSTADPAPSQAPAALTVDYDAAELRASLERELNLLDTQLRSGSNAELLGQEISRLLLRRTYDLRARTASKLRVIVLGDFKRGKSTLINALLGQQVAPMDVLPETITINEFSFADQPAAFLKLEDGGRVAIRGEDLRAARLTSMLERSPARVSRVDVRAPLSLLREIVLIDTPGTGDERLDLNELVSEHLDQADLLLVVVSANAPLSESEQTLLRTAIAPREFSRICFVLNMIDTVRDEVDVGRLVAHLRGKVDRMFPGASVYPLSALDELARLTAGQRSTSGLKLEQRFARFRVDLEQLTRAHSDLLQLDRSLHLAGSTIDQIEAHIELLVVASGRRLDELDASLAHEQARATAANAVADARAARVRARLAALGEQAADWMDEFVDRLALTLPEQITHSTKKDVERDLSFFLGDTLRNALASCVDAHEPALAELIRAELDDDIALSADSAASFDRELSAFAPSDAPRAELGLVENVFRGWAYAHHAPHLLTIANSLRGCLCVFNLADAGLNYALQGEQLQALALRFVSSKSALKTTVRKLTIASYEAVAAQFAEKLAAAQTAQREAQLLTLQQARQLREETEVEAGATRRRLEALLSQLREVRSRVLQLKTRLDASAQSADRASVM